MSETTAQEPDAKPVPGTPGTRGRPRSERAEKAIIEATLDLLAEESGVAGVSIEAVAARAGVGKTTIYRRWPNKESLIVGALATIKAPPRDPSGPTVRDDLLALARDIAAEREHPQARCFWNVMGGAEKHPELFARYKRDVIQPRRELMQRVLLRGVERGELRADTDVEVVIAMIVGVLVHRTPREPLPDDLIESLVDTVLRGIAAPEDEGPAGSGRGGGLGTGVSGR